MNSLHYYHKLLLNRSETDHLKYAGDSSAGTKLWPEARLSRLNIQLNPGSKLKELK